LLESGVISPFVIIDVIEKSVRGPKLEAYIKTHGPIFPKNIFKKILMSNPYYAPLVSEGTKPKFDGFRKIEKYGVQFDESALLLALTTRQEYPEGALLKFLLETQFYVDGKYHIPKDIIPKYMSIYNRVPSMKYMEFLLNNNCEFNEDALVYSLLAFGSDAFNLIKKTQFFVDTKYIFPKDIIKKMMDRGVYRHRYFEEHAFSRLIKLGYETDDNFMAYLLTGGVPQEHVKQWCKKTSFYCRENDTYKFPKDMITTIFKSSNKSQILRLSSKPRQLLVLANPSISPRSNLSVLQRHGCIVTDESTAYLIAKFALGYELTDMLKNIRFEHRISESTSSVKNIVERYIEIKGQGNYIQHDEGELTKFLGRYILLSKVLDRRATEELIKDIDFTPTDIIEYMYSKFREKRYPHHYCYYDLSKEDKALLKLLKTPSTNDLESLMRLIDEGFPYFFSPIIAVKVYINDFKVQPSAKSLKFSEKHAEIYNFLYKHASIGTKLSYHAKNFRNKIVKN